MNWIYRARACLTSPRVCSYVSNRAHPKHLIKIPWSSHTPHHPLDSSLLHFSVCTFLQIPLSVQVAYFSHKAPCWESSTSISNLFVSLFGYICQSFIHLQQQINNVLSKGINDGSQQANSYYKS
jgi:hypothetical protein